MSYSRHFPVADKRVFRASKDAGFPLEAQGIIFYKVSARSVDINNPNKATDYDFARLGNAVILDDDKFTRLITMLSEGRRERYDPQLEPPPRTERQENAQPSRRGGRRNHRRRSNSVEQERRQNASQDEDANERTQTLPPKASAQ